MIQPSPDAPEGSVETLPFYTTSCFPSTSAILCRTTAPLVSFAFALIQRHVGCRVLGREIGQGLITLIKKLNPKDLVELDEKLGYYLNKEVERFERKGEMQSAEAVRDKVQCIQLFLGHSQSIDDLTSKISRLFDDSISGLLTLSTVHKAKGLEWPMVFILDKDKLMPSPWARLPWQQIQERNLIYVAVTRAKLDLRFIESGKWKETEGKVNLSDID